MRKIEFDSGIEEFRLQGGGVLRFNPGDPNIYARFLEAEEKFKDIENGLHQQAKTLEGAPTGDAAVTLTAQADRKIKELLDWVFGGGNDFHKALGGVNLLAVAANGKRVVANLFGALEEILAAGAERFAAEEAEAIRADR